MLLLIFSIVFGFSVINTGIYQFRKIYHFPSDWNGYDYEKRKKNVVCMLS